MNAAGNAGRHQRTRGAGERAGAIQGGRYARQASLERNRIFN